MQLYCILGISRDNLVARLAFFLARPFTKTLEQGAATSVYCATAPEIEGMGGCFFDNCSLTQAHTLCNNEKLQDKLWETSENMIKKFENCVC